MYISRHINSKILLAHSMASFGSLGTATNSNLSNAGNNINTTGRTNMLLQSIYVLNDEMLKKGMYDVMRHEVCVTQNYKGIQAYVPVISTDIGCDKTSSMEIGRDFIRLPHTDPRLHNSQLDMSIATYYQDIGDARSEFELMLARCQISLHSFQTETQKALDKCQDRMLFDRTQELMTKKHRRNAVFFLGDDYDDTADEADHGGKWEKCFEYNRTENEDEGLPQFKKFKPDIADTKVMKNCAVYGILLPPRDRLDASYIGMMLEMLCNFIATNDEIKTLTPKSKNSAPITPPDLRYAGLALTDACMHPQNGDTAVTLNIFSAVTINNGPFDVCTNDELMWIHEVELPDFSSDGLRRRRIVMDIETIHKILMEDRDFIEKQINVIYETITQKITSEPVIKQNNSLPGNPSRKTFLIAPCKRGFTMLQRSSILDHERRMGRAISGAKAGKRLDLINGACAHF